MTNKIFIDYFNNIVKINDFEISLIHFQTLEPSIALPQRFTEFYVSDDDNEEQYVIFEDEKYSVYEHKVRGELLATVTKIDEYKTYQKKISKLAELDVAFETSKKIIVKNGVTLEIKNREIFLSKIKIVGRVDVNPETVYCYYQNEDGVGYSIAAHPIVLQKIYNKYFKHTRQTGTEEFVSDHNKVLEIRYKSKINNATTLEQLDFDFEFENPNGITIEINETANEMLADSSVPEFIKDFINKLKDEEGNIHLIEVLND
jgi:hypothetical protein